MHNVMQPNQLFLFWHVTHVPKNSGFNNWNCWGGEGCQWCHRYSNTASSLFRFPFCHYNVHLSLIDLLTKFSPLNFTFDSTWQFFSSINFCLMQYELGLMPQVQSFQKTDALHQMWTWSLINWLRQKNISWNGVDAGTGQLCTNLQRD